MRLAICRLSPPLCRTLTKLGRNAAQQNRELSRHGR
jgi:hypothetical protein